MRLLVLILLITLVIGCSSGDPLAPSSGDSLSGGTINASQGTPKPGIEGSSNGEVPFATDRDSLPEYVDGEVLIVLNEGYEPEASFSPGKILGLSLIKEIKLKWATVYRMRIDNGQSVESMVSTLKTFPHVRYAEPNNYVYPCTVPYSPNDPYYECDCDYDDDPWTCSYDQWGPSVLGASLCWPEYKGDSDVIVAVLDTGANYNHEDLVNQLWINEGEIPDNNIDDDENGYIDDWRGWDFGGDDNDPWDNYGHGTPCAGIVAAEQDNHKGCSGIAPGCKVMVLSMHGGGYTSAVIEGAQYAYDNGASIVSMSFGDDYDNEIMHETFTSVYEDGNGILLTASAGNDDTTEKFYPASWPEVVKVGASYSFSGTFQRADVARYSFGWGSNYGEDLDLLAPGTNYVTTHANYFDDEYWGINHPGFAGTSCACPCVAACLALLKSAYPDLTAAELRQRLLDTCDDLYTPGHDIESGWGRANVWRAIYGSEPNEDICDENGHIPHPGDGDWFFDNIFDVSTSADYDFEDIFVLDVGDNGLFRLEIDIMTTGEDLDMEIYDNPELSGEPLIVFFGPNGMDKPRESLEFLTSQGPTYYLRVFSPEPNNCSNYGVKYETEPYSYWIEWDSVIYGYTKSGADPFDALMLEINSSADMTVHEIKAYITGNIPLHLVKSLWLFEDTDDSGEWEPDNDNPVQSCVPEDVNQVVFDGLSADVSYGNPARFFIIVELWPNDLGYDVKIGIGLKTYKDILVSGNLPLRDDPFPILTWLSTYYEGTPPVWDTTIGVQHLVPKHELVEIYWNSATDEVHPPTSYNVYWDNDFPPEFDSEKMVEDIAFSDGGIYDYTGAVENLENGKTYYFSVRAVDKVGNEDQNETWLQTFLAGDYDPPVWDTTVGLQDAVPGYEHVTLYWNNATDVMYEPTHYNAYWDDEFPPEISTEKMIEGIPYEAGADYDHKGIVPDLVNGQTYYFCLRAADALGNEDDNEVWLEATPDYLWDPYNPQVIGSHWVSNDQSIDVWVHEQIAYIACGEDGLAIVDCTTPENPILVDKFPTSNCQKVQYYDEQDYVYLADVYDGLLIIDPDAVGGPELVGAYQVDSAYSVCVEDDICYLGTYGPILLVLDVSDPTHPQYISEADIDYAGEVSRIIKRDNYVYCVTQWRFSIVDVSNLENPYVVSFANVGSYAAGIDLWGDYVPMTLQSAFQIIDVSDPLDAYSVCYIQYECGNRRDVAVRDDKYLQMGIGSDLAVLQWDDFENLTVVSSLSMNAVYGLFIEGEFLYVADCNDGLKIIL